mgnify:CR=1 FL=1
MHGSWHYYAFFFDALLQWLKFVSNIQGIYGLFQSYLTTVFGSQSESPYKVTRKLIVHATGSLATNWRETALGMYTQKLVPVAILQKTSICSTSR